MALWAAAWAGLDLWVAAKAAARASATRAKMPAEAPIDSDLSHRSSVSLHAEECVAAMRMNTVTCTKIGKRVMVIMTSIAPLLQPSSASAWSRLKRLSSPADSCLAQHGLS